MAFKSIPVSQLQPIDQIHQHVLFPLHNGVGDNDNEDVEDKSKMASVVIEKNKFVVMGHRGKGMNMLQSDDNRFKAIKENSLRSFNEAAKFNVDFIEFDIQVTRDGHPIIFHDIFIFTQEQGQLIEKRVTDLTLDEFLAYGPQSSSTNVEKPLFRKTKDGRIFEWKVENDDRFCTLEDVFENASQAVGFNIEFKFDDNRSYKEEELVRVIRAALQVIFKHAKDRRIMFSSFQPDAAQLIREQQTTYPVFFLTNGGSVIYSDTRRNSLDEAIKLCLEGGLQGIVSEVKAILRNPRMIVKIKESNLTLFTYGQLNNEQEVVYLQYMIGVEGVIVDFVEEITSTVSQFPKPVHAGKEHLLMLEKRLLAEKRTPCSDDELSYFRRIVPELIHSCTA